MVELEIGPFHGFAQQVSSHLYSGNEWLNDFVLAPVSNLDRSSAEMVLPQDLNQSCRVAEEHMASGWYHNPVGTGSLYRRKEISSQDLLLFSHSLFQVLQTTPSRNAWTSELSSSVFLRSPQGPSADDLSQGEVGYAHDCEDSYQYQKGDQL